MSVISSCSLWLVSHGSGHPCASVFGECLGMQAIGFQRFLMRGSRGSAQEGIHGARGMWGCEVLRVTMWREWSNPDPEPITGHLMMDQTLLANTLTSILLAMHYVLHVHFAFVVRLPERCILHVQFRPVSSKILTVACQQLTVPCFVMHYTCMKVRSSVQSCSASNGHCTGLCSIVL